MLIFYLLTGLGVTVDAQARTAPAQAKAATDWQEMPDGMAANRRCQGRYGAVS